MTWQSEARWWMVTVAAVFCLGSVGYSSIHTSKHVNATLMRLDDTLDKVNGKDGMIQELGKTVVDTKNLIALSTMAEKNEISSLTLWNNQISGAITNFQQVMLQTRSTLAAVQGTSEAATKTVTALQAPIAQATATLKAAQDAIEAGKRATDTLQLAVVHLDALVTDPAIPKTVANVQTMTENGKAATKDLKDYIHGILHPTWPTRIWGYTVDVAHAVL